MNPHQTGISYPFQGYVTAVQTVGALAMLLAPLWVAVLLAGKGKR